MKFPKDKYMQLVKIGEKGQIVIPKVMREMFELNPGDTVVLLADKKKGIAITADMSIADMIFAKHKEPEGEE